MRNLDDNYFLFSVIKSLEDNFQKCTFVYTSASTIMKDSINYFSNLIREHKYLFY